MKTLFALLAVGSLMPMTCLADLAPVSLKGKTVVLNYTTAQYRTVIEEESDSGWVSYAQARKGVKGAGEAFTTSVGIKATRNLLPITAPGQGGIYTYQKTGPSTGVIEVDMWKSKKIDVGRTIQLQFTSPTTAIAAEEVGHGLYTGVARNIKVTIK